MPTQALIGEPLAKLQEDFKLLPPNVLQGYLSDTSVDPSSGFIRTVVAAELSRRRRLEEQSKASAQPDPTTRPTVVQELASAPPTANYANGGIIAFQSGEKVPSTQRPDESFEDFRRRVFEEELARQQEKNEEKAAASEKERLRRLALRPSNLGMGRPFAPLVSEVTDKPVDFDTPYPETASTRGVARAGVTSLLQDAPRNVATPAPAPAPASAYAPTRDTSELDQNLLADGVTDPAIRAALMQSMRADAAAGKQFSYKPQAAPTAPSDTLP